LRPGHGHQRRADSNGRHNKVSAREHSVSEKRE
jgi:hypothetical protein